MCSKRKRNPLRNDLLPGEQLFVLNCVLGKQLPEPGLHDKPLPVIMCEVILQSGNVRLQHPSVSPWCVKDVWWCVRISFTTYPHPGDALQLRLWQISNNHRGGVVPTEQHFIMRGVLCFEALCGHENRDNGKQEINLWSTKKINKSAADLRDGVYSVNPFLRSSQLRVPAHHHPNHMPLALHDHLPNSQKYVRRTRAAHCFGGCSKENSNQSEAERLWIVYGGRDRDVWRHELK